MKKNKLIFVNVLLFILLTTQNIYSKDSYNDYLINAVKTNNFGDVVKYLNKENVNSQRVFFSNLQKDNLNKANVPVLSKLIFSSIFL